MNRTQRKLFLGFATYTAVMLTAITVVLSYAAYQDQLARFGDIFDRVVSQQTQTWVLPTLVVIVGITLVGLIIFIGLWKFHQTDSEND
jgi:uncharacterized membrane protein YidH (DUF202 family)